MNLFEQIVGQGPEVLSCSVLRYLLYRSPELRDATVRLINKNYSKTWVTLKDSFSIRTEVGTLTEMLTITEVGVRGRVDMVMETDNSVIGIEVKLNAKLADDQPEKYVDTLRQRAINRGDGATHLVVLLLPQSYVRDAKKKEGVCILSWEDLLDEMRRADPTDPPVRFLLNELQAFVLAQVGLRKDFNEIFPRLRDRLQDAEHSKHAEIIGWLWPVFRNLEILPNLSTRINIPADKHYVGYSFLSPNVDRDLSGWYGFYDSTYANPKTESTSPLLVFGSSFDIDMTNNSNFEEVVFRHEKLRHWWGIKFSQDWDNLGKWREVMTPLREAIQKHLQTTPIL